MKKTTGVVTKNLQAMLNLFEIKSQGRKNSGIDDTLNISKIIKQLALRGLVFEVNCSVLELERKVHIDIDIENES